MRIPLLGCRRFLVGVAGDRTPQRNRAFTTHTPLRTIRDVGILATIVVVPRETFSQSVLSLEGVFARTQAPFELVCVDGNSPAATRRRLEEHAIARGFTLLRSPHYLSPNEARNVAIAQVRTKYAVFLGNDVLVTDGWLEALVTCAEETGASFVSGVSCWGALDKPVVYCAGGESHLVEDGGRRGIRDVHYHAGRPLIEVRAELRRQPSEAAVFHCMLVRTDVLERLGGLDEELHVLDHVDLCLRAQGEANGGWFEPRSVVMYVPPSPLRGSDVPYFLLRWSRAWIESSFAHFCCKWDIDPGDPGLDGNLRWLHDHRWRLLGRPRQLLHRRAGEHATRAVEAAIDTIVTNTLVRRDARRRASPHRPALIQVPGSRSRP
jgi:glycosyltransferase involved in cell wall biosynthesis